MMSGSRRCHSNTSDLNIIGDDGLSLEKVNAFKYLVLWIDTDLSFKPHIDYILKDLIIACAYFIAQLIALHFKTGKELFLS